MCWPFLWAFVVSSPPLLHALTDSHFKNCGRSRPAAWSSLSFASHRVARPARFQRARIASGPDTTLPDIIPQSSPARDNRNHWRARTPLQQDLARQHLRQAHILFSQGLAWAAILLISTHTTNSPVCGCSQHQRLCLLLRWSECSLAYID